MGVVNIYQGISNEYKTIKGTGSVRDLAHELMPEFDLAHSIIINAGNKITADYQVKDNDIIFIRYIPGAVTTVLAVVSCVVSAVALGAAIYSAVEQHKAQQEMEKAQKQARALSERITQLPFLKGASNRSALGYNIPYVMGNVYNVPYKLVSGFYTISGENGKNQFWNSNFICGYNNAIIQDVSIGSVKIKKSNDTIDVPGQTEPVSILKDSAEFPYLFESDCTYYDPADKLEIKYADEMSVPGIGEKVTARGYGDELDTNEPVTKQLEENTYKADICIKFDGLRRYDEEWKSKSVSIKIEWSSNGSTWNDAGTIDTGEVNSRKTVRFAKTINFSAAQCVGKDITVRLTRITPLEESNSVETAQLCYINCWQYDASKSTTSNIVICRPLESPWRERTTRIGLSVIANDSTKDNLDQINCNVYGRAIIWNGTSWTEGKYPTRNPASWILEIMTTDIHPHSQFSDDEIDLEALGKKVYESCERNHFYCDGIVTEDTKKKDILNNILAECNATMYLDYTTGKWTFAVEGPQTTPVALLTEQCIKNITVSKSFERKPYAMKTTFTNRDSWAVDTFYQTAEGLIDSSQAYGTKKIITETAPKYITTFDHAYKFTRRQIAKQKLQPREITAVVGREGDYYPLYSMVMLQMKCVGLSSGVIHSVVLENNLLTEIVTSDLCDFSDTTKRYGIIIQAQTDNGKNHIYAEVLGTGRTRTIRLKTPTACTIVPEYGNEYSFGYLTEDGSFRTITNKMMIYGAKQTADGWELQLKDYNDAIFEDGPIPEYKSNLTTPKENGTSLPEVTYEKVSDLVDASSIPGKDALTVYGEKNSYIFNADENGTIKETVIENKVHVLIGNKEYPFRFGQIEIPEGFNISTDYHTVLIRGNAGNEMANEGVIKIPVFYHPISEEIKIGFGNTVISNGAEPIGYYNFSEKETKYKLYFSYAKSVKGEQGNATWNASFDISSFCFACDENGNAWGETVPAKIKLLQGDKEVPFTITSVGNNSSELSARIENDTIIFESVAGAKIKESASVPVTINFRPSEIIGIGIGAATFGANGIGIGYRKYIGPEKNFTLYFNYSTVKAGVNRGLKTSIDSYLEPSGKRYKGDFFTWGGETTSIVYNGVTYTFNKGHVYNWNGNQWAESKDEGQLSQSFNNVMAVLDDEVVSNNSKLEMTVKKLSAITIFCEELATQVAFMKKLFAQNITMQPGGLFKSQQWNGTFDQTSKKITGYGSKGWAQDYSGTADYVNLHATKATLQDCILGGYLWGNNTPFKPCASFNIGYKDGSLNLYNGKNIQSITREEEGVFVVYFQTPIKLRTHSWSGHNYIDLFVVGNCHSTFSGGFTDPLIPEINWVRNWVDGRLSVSGGFANVTYAKIYFDDNTQDNCLDPNGAQCFMFGTETD